MFSQSCNLLQIKLGWEDCKNTMHHNANAPKPNKCPSAETCLHYARLYMLACISKLRDVWKHSMPKQKMHTHTVSYSNTPSLM